MVWQLTFSVRYTASRFRVSPCASSCAPSSASRAAANRRMAGWGPVAASSRSSASWTSRVPVGSEAAPVSGEGGRSSFFSPVFKMSRRFAWADPVGFACPLPADLRGGRTLPFTVINRPLRFSFGDRNLGANNQAAPLQLLEDPVDSVVGFPPQPFADRPIRRPAAASFPALVEQDQIKVQGVRLDPPSKGRRT